MTQPPVVLPRPLKDELDYEQHFGDSPKIQYLMGINGIDVPTVADLEQVGFANPLKAFWAFQTEHQNLMADWYITMSCRKCVWPNQKQIFQDISMFHTLTSMKQSDVIDFVSPFLDLLDIPHCGYALLNDGSEVWDHWSLPV